MTRCYAAHNASRGAVRQAAATIITYDGWVMWSCDEAYLPGNDT